MLSAGMRTALLPMVALIPEILPSIAHALRKRAVCRMVQGPVWFVTIRSRLRMQNDYCTNRSDESRKTDESFVFFIRMLALCFAI